MSQRLHLALGEGGLVLPASGRIGVFHPRPEHDLTPLGRDRVDVVQPFFPAYRHFEAAGYHARPDLARTADQAGSSGLFAASVVFLPRAKALARSLLSDAAKSTSGAVIVDGAKTDGIDSVLKEMRKRTAIGGVISKAHGKLFWFDASDAELSDWQTDTTLADGFRTAPGVFSADGVDPASRLLADALPEKIGAAVGDLGAGWGYLSARLLEREGIKTLHLVEADHAALSCARANISDPRAQVHWADALDWAAPERLDAVVMNPPFHTGRRAEPDLGRGFIAAAARALAPSGRLWMVANRHLPYETHLQTHFAESGEFGGDGRFKLLRAARPRRVNHR